MRLEGTEGTLQELDGHPQLITFGRPSSNRLSAFRIPGDDYLIHIEAAEKLSLSELDETNLSIGSYILSRGVRSTVHEPLKVDFFDVYDTSTDLTERIPDEARSDPLVSPIRVHAGISYQFRLFDQKPMAQILPKSRITYEKTMWDLLHAGMNEAELIERFPYAAIQELGSMRLLEVSELSTNDAIADEPFNGRSFSQYASDFYPSASSSREDARLVRVATPTVTYFPSDWVRPSITFTGISFLNDKFYSQLISLLKMQGRERPGRAKGWASKLSPLKFEGQEVGISLVPRAIPFRHQRCELKELLNTVSFNTGILFAPPSVNFLRDGEEVEIYPEVENYQATVNDLLKNQELKPLDVPPRLKFIVFIDDKLSDGWKLLKKSLIEGKGDYRGFKATFGADPFFDEVTITNFPSEEFVDRASKLSETSYDCAIIVIPRHLQTQLASKAIYVLVKTRIMERGIPVQVITDEQKITFGRNSTLRGKSESAFAVFGIAINLLVKTGAVLTSLSNSSTSDLLSNSIVMGYNVARVVTPETSGEKTIPLAAPLVIFDAKGAYISHQGVYRLWNEASLFEQWGDEIFDCLPSNVTHLVVHKDGFFRTSELVPLNELAESRGISAIPVSTRTGNVPRVFNPSYYGNDTGLKAGSTLPLSKRDFLMVTTPISSWDPSRQGWPNPIMITLHERSMNTQVALRILYHMFALTKMQTGSQRPVRTPVSIHFANMIARFLTKAGETTPTFLRHFVRPRPGGRSVPRWFS